MRSKELLEQRAKQVVDIIKSNPVDIAQEKVWEALEDLDVDISITITKPSGGGVPYIKSVDTEDNSEIDDFEDYFDSGLEGVLEI